MKIVVNKAFGGFSLPRKFCTQYNFDPYDDIDRTDERLVNFIESCGGHTEVDFGDLQIVAIPDNSTDWEISNYDGFETVLYVVDGKIHRK